MISTPRIGRLGSRRLRRDIRRAARHVSIAAITAALLLPAVAARADALRFTADDPRWRAECGSCHLAFAPPLMTAAAWRQVMSSLDRHYGTDATLDAPTAAAITAFLERNAGGGKRAAPPAPMIAGAGRTGSRETLPRITTSPWFQREHRRISAAGLGRKGVGGFSDCAACHGAADRGIYDERTLVQAR